MVNQYLLQYLLKQQEDELIYGLAEENASSSFDYIVNNIIDNSFSGCKKLKRFIRTPNHLQYIIYQADESYFDANDILEHYESFRALRIFLNSVHDPNYVVKAQTDLMKHLSFMCELSHEEAYVLLFNNAMEFIKMVNLGVGKVTSTTVNIKKMIKEVVLTTTCTGVIFAHNHPSGNLTASESDIKLGSLLFKALNSIEVKLLDCVIVVPKGKVTSFISDVIQENL